VIAVKKMIKVRENRMGYATAADFAEIFATEMHSLFLLALLLTADMKKAEQCFVCGLEECVDGMDSFLAWARIWARRSIVKHAIRIVAPTFKSDDMPQVTNLDWPGTEETINLFLRLMSLKPFERFAFVLSFLEAHSGNDCNLLLGCRRRDFEAARTSAMRTLCRFGASGDQAPRRGKSLANMAAAQDRSNRWVCRWGNLASFGTINL
jgi:hypothetical protein